MRQILAMVRAAHMKRVRRLTKSDETVILPPCEVCKLLPPGSWDRWLCELINGC